MQGDSKTFPPQEAHFGLIINDGITQKKAFQTLKTLIASVKNKNNNNNSIIKSE